jgi:putative tricarboxylic transport membrane protein
MVLGDLMEQAMRQSLMISDGSLAIFVTRPFALFFLMLAVISITNPYWKYIGIGLRRVFGRGATAA